MKTTPAHHARRGPRSTRNLWTSPRFIRPGIAELARLLKVAGVLGAFLLASAGSNADAGCREDSREVTWPDSRGLRIFACIAPSALGAQSVGWAVCNLTNDELEVRFTKVYRLTCGNSVRRDAHLFLDPGEFASGGGFHGELDLGDEIWKEDCAREDRVAGLSIEDLQIINRSEIARTEARQEEERARQQQREQEQQRLEQERLRQQEAEAARREQEKRERSERDQTERARQEEQRQRVEAQRERERQAREQAQRAEAERRAAIQARWNQDQQTAGQQRALQQTQLQQNTALIVEGGGGNVPTGPSWRLHFLVGTGAVIIPLVEDSFGADIYSYSSDGSGGGISTHLALEAWPLYGRNFGIGVVASGALGFMPAEGGSSYGHDVEAGGRMMLGAERALSGLLQFSIAFRRATTASNTGYGIIDAYSKGSADYVARRIGAGLQLCTSPNETGFCDGGMALWLFLDRPDFLGEAADSPLSWRVEFFGRGSISLGVDFSWNYPVAGMPSYPLHEDMEIEKLRLVGFLAADWDYFGDPY